LKDVPIKIQRVGKLVDMGYYEKFKMNRKSKTVPFLHI